MKRLTFGIVLAIVLAACGDGTDAGVTTDAPATTDAASTQAPTSTPASPPSTTTTEPPAGLTIPNSDFHGVVWTLFDGDTLTFTPSGSKQSSVDAPIVHAQPGCGLDMHVTSAGVEVGLEFFGGSAEAELFAWGTSGSSVVPNSSDGEADVRWEHEGTVVSIGDETLPQSILITTGDGSAAQIAGEPSVPYVQLLGFDGRTLLVRAEPDEPVCDRGVVVSIDLTDGTTSCVNGRNLVARLTGSAAHPETVVAPTLLVSDIETCNAANPPDPGAALLG